MKKGLRLTALTAAACLVLSGFPVGWSCAEASVSHPDKYSGYVVEEGIDVSIWNGLINWFKVKESGVDFAFVRAGGVYYNSGVFYPDENFERNVDGAILAGIDTGVYFYSQAISEEEAVKEAEYVLSLIDGRELQMPVVFDFEYAGGGTEGRLYNAHLSAREQTNICMKFCETIEEAGYDAMVYANAYMLWHRLYGNEIQDKYGVWLAEYHWNGGTATYLGEYDFWQYTQYGLTEGIEGYTDRNYRYIEPTVDVDCESARCIKLSWPELNDADGYMIYRKYGEREYELLAEIKGSEVSSYNDSGIRTGREYTYKIVPYETLDDGSIYEITDLYPEVSGRVSWNFSWRR